VNSLPARSLSTSPTRSTFSGGFPPTLFVKDTDSLGEQIQAAFPRLRVVHVMPWTGDPVGFIEGLGENVIGRITDL
jgi:hypothetical protein